MGAAEALHLGLISGTSADGIDVALASFEPAPRLHAALTHPYPPALRRRILDLAQGDGRISLDELGALDIEIARVFAEAAGSLLERHGIAPGAISALGSHGQTVRHRPAGATPYTLQLGDANVIAELTGIVTVADFRRRDMAAGGQGAPLAPAFHAAMLGGDVPRVVLNLGGIANISVLSGDPADAIVGFDTGPASCLLDAWAERQLGQAFDRDGDFAASGQVDNALLMHMLSDPYFALPPPKSTGREVFHPGWLQQQVGDATVTPADVQATLLALTVQTIAAAIRTHAARTGEVLVCGGGVHNAALMSALGNALAPLPVQSIATRGIDPDFVEAMLFAWLAHERLHDRPSLDVARVTGARGARVLGGIYFGG
ncbi:MAG TPA: anhydro-N-acetylmuramic acid kinase [Rudaea sp.]